MKNTANNLFLTSAEESKKLYCDTIGKMASAIASSVPDTGKAYSGPPPEELRKIIGSMEFFPEKGLGFDAVLEDMKGKILPNFLRPFSTSYMAHLHSPGTMESIAAELAIATYNQSMDSWDQSPVGTEVEAFVCRELCQLYGFGPESDGVFTSGGSQSNESAVFMARDWFCREKLHRDVKKYGLPPEYSKLRLYTSEISHFSMDKACHMLGLGYEAAEKVPVDDAMRMDAAKLEEQIRLDLAAGNLPFCVVCTVGTTDFGSIDPIEKIEKLCRKYGLWMHVDAAYGSGLILSKPYRSRIAGVEKADSLTVDFHKMFLIPISGSVLLLKNGAEFECFELHADYLNREEDEEDGYINLVGKSLQTTRRFDALKVWVAFRTRGQDGWSELITRCVDNASSLYAMLEKDPAFTPVICPEISSVVFRFNGSDEVNKRVRRRLLLQEGIVIGQTVCRGQVCLKFTLLNPLLTPERLSEILSVIRRLGEEESSHKEK